MRCVYCNKELKSSADDYEGCICSECKKPKYPFQQGILEQQNEIEKLKQENKQLKEQLAEKDKEIEELKAYKKGAYEKYVSKCAYLQQQIKDTRKQVCDEIRRKMTVYRYIEVKTKKGFEWALTDNDINDIIDKVEQAKESMK